MKKIIILGMLVLLALAAVFFCVSATNTDVPSALTFAPV